VELTVEAPQGRRFASREAHYLFNYIRLL